MLFKFRSRQRRKIFCIGANKTGTTSLEKALSDLGYKMGNQDAAQGLIDAYAQRRFDQIIKFCHTAEAFQDSPFSWHYTFMHLDQAFPDAKFILSVRDSADQWYESLVRFHSKIYTADGSIPTEADLKRAQRGQGRTAWDNFSVRHKMIPGDPYNKELMQSYYNEHNRMVKDYFRFKDNLLVINLAEQRAYQRFCDFIELDPIYNVFPRENRTA